MVEGLLAVRTLQPQDLEAVVSLDSLLTRRGEAACWRDVFERYVGSPRCIGLVVEGDAGIEGYLLGEVRAFEFGSDECGWIFALGVRPDSARRGRASALLREARRRFRALGVRSIRTMVQRTDVPMLSLFRRHGFVGGPFVQLELDTTRGAQR